MDYEELTDFEINKLVAKSKGYKSLPDIEGDDRVFIVPCDNPEVFDPCNNPSDAWPIIFDNKIGLFCALKSGGMWWADKKVYTDEGFNRSIMSGNKNPLRSAMIVYLMMESEKATD